jgi:hypothetical protein
MAPITANGSHVMYANIVRPLFHEHNEKVESALSAVTQHLTTEKEIPVMVRKALDEGVDDDSVLSKKE